MQNDCEIYVDPEEDEVFFGCMSEREKIFCAKLLKHAESSPNNDCQLDKVSDECIALDVDEENIVNSLKSEQSNTDFKENIINVTADLIIEHKEFNNSFEKGQEWNKISSNNVSVELEHNYSTPMKHKIDKSILTTPKSIVKADKDGGFLKILSEIALVKAEAEGDKKSENKKEDEDKENKIMSSIPEIKITEATPDKESVLSPPKSINTNLRRFRIIYNSPLNKENVDYKTKMLVVNSFENERNFKNKSLDSDVEVLGDDKNKVMNLTNFKSFTECDLNVSVFFEKEEIEDQARKHSYSFCDSEKKNDGIILKEKKPSDENKSVKSPKLKSDTKFNIDMNLLKIDSPPSDAVEGIVKSPNSLRFSKEARQIVDLLKKSAVDDSLNFTIPEMDLENENSFLSPESMPALEETVTPNKAIEIQQEKSSPKILTRPADNKLMMKSKTVEKEQHKVTPIVSKSKLQPVRYFSERRIYNQHGIEAKKNCMKKLTMEDKKPIVVEKVSGGRIGESNAPSSSKIPVFGAKNSKIPLIDRVVRPLTPKNTSSKTPSGKIYKNRKFNHIESPVNAYIHNKPTTFVLNVKPEGKKNNLAKVWKTQTAGNEKKTQEKAPKLQNPNSAPQLPFVDYKSGTPYKIEKGPESRLPRLAPTFMKLIGSHSPKVLKHEGRFYVKTPRKQISAEDTIVADPVEVSVVLSQPAQKKNTIT